MLFHVWMIVNHNNELAANDLYREMIELIPMATVTKAGRTLRFGEIKAADVPLKTVQKIWEIVARYEQCVAAMSVDCKWAGRTIT